MTGPNTGYRVLFSLAGQGILTFFKAMTDAPNTCIIRLTIDGGAPRYAFMDTAGAWWYLWGIPPETVSAAVVSDALRNGDLGRCDITFRSSIEIAASTPSGNMPWCALAQYQ